MLQREMRTPRLSAEEFATAVERLITDARAKGLLTETLLVEIEDIASLLREALDLERLPDLDRRRVELPWSFRTPVRPSRRT